MTLNNKVYQDRAGRNPSGTASANSLWSTPPIPPPPIKGFYSRQPLNPLTTPTDITAEEYIANVIQRHFDLNQISEDLYNKLMQSLLEELDK